MTCHSLYVLGLQTRDNAGFSTLFLDWTTKRLAPDIGRGSRVESSHESGRLKRRIGLQASRLRDPCLTGGLCSGERAKACMNRRVLMGGSAGQRMCMEQQLFRDGEEVKKDSPIDWLGPVALVTLAQPRKAHHTASTCTQLSLACCLLCLRQTLVQYEQRLCCRTQTALSDCRRRSLQPHEMQLDTCRSARSKEAFWRQCCITVGQMALLAIEWPRARPA